MRIALVTIIETTNHQYGVYTVYDAVSDVVESGVHWRSNFQIGSRVLKTVINLLLCIIMTYNVISCIEVAEITQTLKIADFTM